MFLNEQQCNFNIPVEAFQLSIADKTGVSEKIFPIGQHTSLAVEASSHWNKFRSYTPLWCSTKPFDFKISNTPFNVTLSAQLWHLTPHTVFIQLFYKTGTKKVSGFISFTLWTWTQENEVLREHRHEIKHRIQSFCLLQIWTLPNISLYFSTFDCITYLLQCWKLLIFTRVSLQMPNIGSN